MAMQTTAKKHHGFWGKLLRACAIGAAAGLVCSILFSLAAALVIDESDLPHRSIVPISVTILAVSAFVAGFVAGVINHRQALVVGAVTALIMFAVVFLASFFVPDKEIGASLFVKLAAVFLPSIVASVISVNLPRRD